MNTAANPTMNYLKAGVFFFICWLVQTTLLWRIWPFGTAAGAAAGTAAPSLLLCAAVCFAWLYDRNYALVYAVAFGLMLDIQTQALFGVQALALLLSLIPAMLMRRHFNPENALPAMLAAAAATPIKTLALWATANLFAATAPHTLSAAIGALPELLISQTAICLILHLALVHTIIKDKRDRRAPWENPRRENSRWAN